MIKKLKIILFFIILFTGCMNQNVNNSTNSKDIIVMEYGHSPRDIASDYIYYYDGNDLKMPYNFYGGRVDSEVGLLVFIDGIVQSYKVNDYEDIDNIYMQIFKIKSNYNSVYDLYIKANTDFKDNFLNLNFVCVDLPKIYFYDKSKINLQNISSSVNWKLVKSNNLINENFLASNLNEKLIPVNLINNISNKTDYAIFQTQLKNISEQNTENKTLEYEIISGENAGKYRSTLFINNMPVSIDKKTYIDCEISENEKKTFTFKISNKKIDEINLAYIITIKLDNDQQNIESNVHKTESILLE